MQAFGKTPSFPCRDCTVNTIPINGDREYYEVKDAIWHFAGADGFGQSDNGIKGYYLCVGCLESRLGRLLTFKDFKPYPANSPSPWLSERLNVRLVGFPEHFPYGTKESTPQFFPNALMDSVVRQFKPEVHYTSPTGAYAITKAPVHNWLAR